MDGVKKTPRQWIAWKLQQLAARIYDGEWVERILITTPAGKTLEINVLGDEYGCGISSTSGIHWQLGPPETAEVEGWKFIWAEPVRWEES